MKKLNPKTLEFGTLLYRIRGDCGSSWLESLVFLYRSRSWFYFRNSSGKDIKMHGFRGFSLSAYDAIFAEISEIANGSYEHPDRRIEQMREILALLPRCSSTTESKSEVLECGGGI